MVRASHLRGHDRLREQQRPVLEAQTFVEGVRFDPVVGLVQLQTFAAHLRSDLFDPPQQRRSDPDAAMRLIHHQLVDVSNLALLHRLFLMFKEQKPTTSSFRTAQMYFWFGDCKPRSRHRRISAVFTSMSGHNESSNSQIRSMSAAVQSRIFIMSVHRDGFSTA